MGIAGPAGRGGAPYAVKLTRWVAIETEVVPVTAPTMVTDPDDPACNEYALPGDFLVLEGASVWVLRKNDFQTYFAPPPKVSGLAASPSGDDLVGPRDFL